MNPTSETEEDNELTPKNLPDEDIELYLLNENNKFITVNFIESIFKNYNIATKVYNLDLYKEATTHVSYIKRDFKNDKNFKIYYLFDKKNIHEKLSENMKKLVIPLQEKSYERLEFLGDQVIKLAMTEYLFKRFNKANEGFMTTGRASLENSQVLAILTKKLELDKYIIISKSLELLKFRTNKIHLLEDCFESFIGAIYLDNNCNFDMCRKLVINLLENEIDIPLIVNTNNNFKTTLGQYFHKQKYKKEPRYECINTIETNTSPIFEMGVYDNDDKLLGTGKGKNKRYGEQIASKNALIHYGLIVNNTPSNHLLFTPN